MGGRSQTSTSEPWKPAQGALQTTLNDAGKLYGGGIGGGIWTGPTNAPLTNQHMGGLATMEARAREFQPWISSGNKELNAISQAGPSYSERNLGDVASGRFLGGGDPHFESVLDTSGRRAMDAVNLQAGAMGRSGSTANMDSIARTIGELQTGARSDQYNRERGYQMNANEMLDAQRGLGFDRQFAAFDRKPAAFEQALLPGRVMMEAGDRYQQVGQNVLDDQIRMFDAAQSAPWEQLARYQGIAQGMGSLGGTQTQKQNMGFGGVLGGLAQLAGMF